MSPLLSVRDLTVTFPGSHGGAPVVEGVDLTLEAGETLALVGESGSGKTVTALSLLGLLPAHARVTGEMEIAGVRPGPPGSAAWRQLRGGTVGMVFQDAGGALNPVRSIGAQLREVLDRHRGLHGKSAEAEAVRLLEEVGLSDPARAARSYPHQLSGGMRQRALIALALAAEPRLLVADEPTSALDASVQLRVLELIKELTGTRNLGTLLITHDFGVVAHASRRVSVMYAGRVVEEGESARVMAAPAHPYTRGLLGALPRAGRPKEPLEAMPGRIPPPGERATGCTFRDRCPLAAPECAREPGFLPLAEREGTVRCWFSLEPTR